MSVLGKLSGKSLEVDIGGEKLTLKPLPFKDREILVKITTAKPEEQVNAITEFIMKVLKNSYPDATQEELDNISLEHIQTLMENILKLHGMEVKGDLKKLVSEAKSQKK